MELDWRQLGTLVVRLGIAYLLALPIGWERERSDRTMGMRTFPLVAVASAAFIVLTLELYPLGTEAHARVLQGLITGIGFIGAGAILKGEREVYGTATAASVWATAAIGASCGYGHFEIGVLVSAVTFGTLRWMTPVKEAVEERAEGGDDRQSRPDDAG